MAARLARIASRSRRGGACASNTQKQHWPCAAPDVACARQIDDAKRTRTLGRAFTVKGHGLLLRGGMAGRAQRSVYSPDTPPRSAGPPRAKARLPGQLGSFTRPLRERHARAARRAQLSALLVELRVSAALLRRRRLGWLRCRCLHRPFRPRSRPHSPRNLGVAPEWGRSGRAARKNRTPGATPTRQRTVVCATNRGPDHPRPHWTRDACLLSVRNCAHNSKTLRPR